MSKDKHLNRKVIFLTLLSHFWHNSVKVEPCHLVNWMNSLPNGLIKINERIYCEKDLLSKSKKVLSHLRKRDLEQIRLAFYSNNFFNEINFSNEILTKYQDELKKLVIEDEEMIAVGNMMLNINSKYIEKDTLDVIRVIFPMSSELNSGKINKYLIQTYVIKDGIYKLLGFRLDEIDVQKKIGNKKI